MRYFDTDADRKIDAKEFAAGQQMASVMLMLSWETCDLDGDGAVSFAEFRSAAAKGMQALLESATESEQQAEQELARVLPLKVLLEQLGQDDGYVDEIAALRDAIEDLDDDDAIITHIATYPKRYPHVAPILRTWYRHHPLKSGVRHRLRPLHARPHALKPKAKAVGPAKPKAGTVGPKNPPKVGGKSGPKKPPKRSGKPNAKPKPRGGRRP